MQYYSTNKQAPDVTLEEAVVKGLAADKGLFMTFTIKPLPQEIYDSIDTLGFQEIAYRVADAFFGKDGAVCWQMALQFMIVVDKHQPGSYPAGTGTETGTAGGIIEPLGTQQCGKTDELFDNLR